MKSGSLVVVALLLIFAAGCGDSESWCGQCPDEGCATMDEALDSWAWLIECCARMYQPENKVKWEARWTHVPPDWILACTGRQTCTDYGRDWTNCTDKDDPITWENEAEMDECLMSRRTAENAMCDGDTLLLCGGRGTSSSVDCAGFCGESAATCVFDGEGLATCSCGFPFVDAY